MVFVRTPIIRTLTIPEYLDYQGAGTVTLTIPFDTILWCLIVADQPPGIFDAIGKFKLPEPEVIVGLVFW